MYLFPDITSRNRDSSVSSAVHRIDEVLQDCSLSQTAEPTITVHVSSQDSPILLLGVPMMIDGKKIPHSFGQQIGTKSSTSHSGIPRNWSHKTYCEHLSSSIQSFRFPSVSSHVSIKSGNRTRLVMKISTNSLPGRSTASFASFMQRRRLIMFGLEFRRWMKSSVMFTNLNEKVSFHSSCVLASYTGGAKKQNSPPAAQLAATLFSILKNISYAADVFLDRPAMHAGLLAKLYTERESSEKNTV